MRSVTIAPRILKLQKHQNVAALLTKRHLFVGEEGAGSQHGRGDQGQSSNWARLASTLAAGAAATALTLAATDRLTVHAKDDSGEEAIIAKENRLRAFSTPDKIFNFFASYQVQSAGRPTMMMSPMEFYSAITPDCTMVHGVGSAAYVKVTQEEIDAGKAISVKSPLKKSVLNDIGDCGLLSYADFNVLLALLATPRRYIDTIFNLFDVTGDGAVEVKEFAYVSTKMAHKSGGFGSYTDIDQAEILTSSSGLLNYLFGKNRDGSLTKEKFCKLQHDLLEEIIELEFREYDKGNTGRISEADFVKFLLKNGKITPKKRNQLEKKIEKIWPSKGRGISLPSFKSFFHVLAGSAELERALFFLDVEGTGVDKEEFRKISSWVSGENTSDHVVNVIYAMLDDDEDGRIYRDDIAGVLLDWRQARGSDKAGVHVTLGQIRI
jgi:Ca2+-binding EF-hand superfamily protein